MPVTNPGKPDIEPSTHKLYLITPNLKLRVMVVVTIHDRAMLIIDVYLSQGKNWVAVQRQNADITHSGELVSCLTAANIARSIDWTQFEADLEDQVLKQLRKGTSLSYIPNSKVKRTKASRDDVDASNHDFTGS